MRMKQRFKYEPGKKSTIKSYIWVYASIKEAQKTIRIFDYKPIRAGYTPERFLEGFQGAVITDAYAGYNSLEGVTNVNCVVHARRKFSDSMPKDMKNTNGALAQEGLKKISALFKIEQITGKSYWLKSYYQEENNVHNQMIKIVHSYIDIYNKSHYRI